MIDRLIIIREREKLNQEDFAKKIGVSRNFISLVETGKRNLSDRTIADICRIFNINETWLRTGEGEMLVQKSRNDEISDFIGDVLSGEPDFRRLLVSILSRMTTDEWKMLEQKALELAASVQLLHPPTQERTEPDIGGQARTQTDIAAELAELKRQNQEKDKQLQALAAKVAAMEEEDALLTGAFSASPSASAGSIRLAEKVKK